MIFMKKVAFITSIIISSVNMFFKTENQKNSLLHFFIIKIFRLAFNRKVLFFDELIVPQMDLAIAPFDALMFF